MAHTNMIRRVALEGESLGGGHANHVVVTDHNAMQVTFPQEGKTAFGELAVARMHPVFQGAFLYNIPPGDWDSLQNQSGTVSYSQEQAVVNTGAAASSAAYLVTKRRLAYRPGFGNRTRFTAAFSNAVANSTQFAGIGNQGNGFFFGYDNTGAFGILHRRYGSREIRTLTVNTASSHAESITIQLDGVNTSVAVTASGVITTTVNEIAAGNYANAGNGWSAMAVGNTVVFQTWDAAPKSGSFGITGTSANGTYAQTVAGVNATTTFYPQSEWTGADKFDGSGASGVTLNPQNGNVYQIAYQYLGYGAIYFFVEDPDDGEFHTVHTIEYANANSRPSLGNPTLPFTAEVKNTTNNTAITVKCASVALISDHELEFNSFRRGVSVAATIATANATPFLSVLNPLHWQGKSNNSITKILRVFVSANHTKEVQIAFYANPKLTGASFAAVNTALGPLLYDTSATAFSGGTFLFSIPLGNAGQAEVNFFEDEYGGMLDPGYWFTAVAVPKSGTNAEVTLSVQFTELF